VAWVQVAWVQVAWVQVVWVQVAWVQVAKILVPTSTHLTVGLSFRQVKLGSRHMVLGAFFVAKIAKYITKIEIFPFFKRIVEWDVSPAKTMNSSSPTLVISTS